jgi:hypothetical protein
MGGRDRQPVAKGIATIAWRRHPAPRNSLSRAQTACLAASILRSFPVGIILERRRPYLALEAPADARADPVRPGGRRNEWPLRADGPQAGVTPVPCVLLRMDMPGAARGLGGRQDRNGQERRRTDRQCRKFEVPAPQGANSFQEFQMEKRHWRRKPDRRLAHGFLLTTSGNETRAGPAYSTLK